MLRVAALVAAVFTLGALPGVEDAEAPAEETFRWTSASAPSSDVETRNATADTPPTVVLRRGRIAVAAAGGDRDQQVLIEAGPVAITVTSGQVLVDHVDGTCFVVVVVGSALVRGVHSQHRGILLQSRQGIASAVDGALADVLTFERVPRLNDPEPLAMQANAAPRASAHDEPWPEEVPLLAAPLPSAPEPVAAAAPLSPDEASEADETAAALPTTAPAAESPATATSAAPSEMPHAAPTADPAIVAAPVEAAGDTAVQSTAASWSQVPAWQRRGRH